jgi:hypothetical protein
VKEGEGKVCKVKGGAFSASGDDIDTVSGNRGLWRGWGRGEWYY